MKRVAGALSVRPLPFFLLGLSAAHQQMQPLDVALRDAVGGVTLERLLVGLQGLRRAVQLGERLAEPVVGINVGAELEKLTIRVDRLLPFTARGVRDGLLAELASLSGRGIGFSKRHERK